MVNATYCTQSIERLPTHTHTHSNLFGGRHVVEAQRQGLKVPAVAGTYYGATFSIDASAYRKLQIKVILILPAKTTLIVNNNPSVQTVGNATTPVAAKRHSENAMNRIASRSLA